MPTRRAVEGNLVEWSASNQIAVNRSVQDGRMISRVTFDRGNEGAEGNGLAVVFFQNGSSLRIIDDRRDCCEDRGCEITADDLRQSLNAALLDLYMYRPTTWRAGRTEDHTDLFLITSRGLIRVRFTARRHGCEMGRTSIRLSYQPAVGSPATAVPRF